jgi:hypothetical protein
MWRFFDKRRALVGRQLDRVLKIAVRSEIGGQGLRLCNQSV